MTNAVASMDAARAAVDPTRRRETCNVCGTAHDSRHDETADVPCHVRVFRGHLFRLWRCSVCRTIHCLDVVDLDYYYSKYPFSQARLDLVWRIFYMNLARRFIRHGMTPAHRFLDYGCANGLFCTALRGRGFRNVYGYDPYSANSAFADERVLEHAPFDYILLQDVLEHVEDPNALLARLDRLLAVGGHILVGTPNAQKVDLSRPDVFRNELHAPYHLHIYTRSGVERMGQTLGWHAVKFYDRSYHDRPWFALNTRAAKTYQSLKDGSFDAFFEPFDIRTALGSPSFWFHAVFGYWLSYRSDMSLMFRKGD